MKRAVLVRRTVLSRQDGLRCSQSCPFYRTSWSHKGPVCDLSDATARLSTDGRGVALRSEACLDAEGLLGASDDAGFAGAK